MTSWPRDRAIPAVPRPSEGHPRNRLRGIDAACVRLDFPDAMAATGRSGYNCFMTTPSLVLGPMVRYVDETSASVWVETQTAARVSIRAGGRGWEARTFAVHGHHYALVELDGLESGTVTPYALDVNGTQVWPDPSSGFPPSMIATRSHNRSTTSIT